MRGSAVLLFARSRLLRNNLNENSLKLSKITESYNQGTSQERFLDFDELFSNILKGDQLKKRSPNRAYDMSKSPKTTVSYSELMQQKLSMGSHKDVEEALAPAIQHMGSISSNLVLVKYLLSVIDKFDAKRNVGKLDLAAIRESKPETPLLNQYTFPVLMKHGLTKLNDLKSPLESITIFETLKSKSLQTFIFGCGIINYNEYIKVQWSCFQDITKILNILEELKINGIQGNFTTLDILADIKKEYSDSISQDDLIESSSYIWSERNEADLQKLKQYIHDLNTYLS